MEKYAVNILIIDFYTFENQKSFHAIPKTVERMVSISKTMDTKDKGPKKFGERAVTEKRQIDKYQSRKEKKPPFSIYQTCPVFFSLSC